MKITCIGSGVFSYAIATLLKEKGNTLMIWSHNKEVFTKENWATFQNEHIFYTTDLKEACSFSDEIFLLISSPFMEDILTKIKEFDIHEKTLYIGTKGLLSHEPYFYSSYCEESDISNVYSFCGPNLAKDLSMKTPANITFSGKSNKEVKIKEMFPDFISITINPYIKDTELASVLKNIYAIGSGILWEQFASKSTMISYLSLCYQELSQILSHVSIDILGDLFLTGIMPEGRNFTYGRLLLKDKEESKTYQKQTTVEGANMIKLISQILEVEHYPILQNLIHIIKNEKNPLTFYQEIFVKKNESLRMQ